MWDEIQDMSGEIFDFDDVPAEIRNDPDFAFLNDLDNEDSRKVQQGKALLVGYTFQQVKSASFERLQKMNDPITRRNRSKLAQLP
jgi:hypothetical protein